MSDTAISRELKPDGYILDDLEYLEETEAAAAIGVTLQTLIGYRKQGLGPHYTEVARRIYYGRPAIAEWLKAGGTRITNDE